MERGQRSRESFFKLLLAGLTRMGVRPGLITFASLAVGLTFAPVWAASHASAMVLLALHVLLDGVDGPLARLQQRDSARGSFTDTVCDQLVLAGVVVVLMADQRVSAPAGTVFLFLYTLVVSFAMVRNAMGIPYSWLIRPRFFLYLAIPVEVWLRPGILTPLCLALSSLLAAKAASGFVAIRRGLTGTGESGD